MRQLRFKRMVIEGFKNYRKQVVLDLYPSPGLHFLSGDNQDEQTLGSNGSGKSSLWEAFCWIIKGRTLDGLRNPDIQPWNTTATTDGGLILDCDGEQQTISRTANPNSLLLDGEPVGQEAVDELFGGLSLEAIGHTIIHGQGRGFFFDLPPSKKMELLSETLRLDRYEEASAVAKKRVDQLAVKVVALKTDRQSLGGRQEEVERLLEGARKAQKEWSDRLVNARKIADDELKVEEKLLLAVGKRRDEAKLLNDTAGTEAKALEREITQNTVYWRDATAKFVAARGEVRITQAKLDDASGLVDLIRHQKECPTCHQSLDRRRLLPEAEEKVSELKERLAELEGIARVAKGVEVDLEEQLTEARSVLERFRRQEEESQTTLNVTEPEVGRLRARINLFKQRRDDIDNEANPYSDDISQHRHRLEELKTEISKVDKDIDRHEAAQQRADFWIKGFKEIRLMIIQEALAQMQLLATGMLEESGLFGWELEYVSEQTTKSETLKSGVAVLVKPRATDKFVRWESFAGGEKQRLRLIGSRALAEVLLNNAGITVNLEVFDEPTAALSSEGIEDLVNLLAEQARWSNKAIFLVDQHAIPSDRFASVIRVVRTKEGSGLAI